MTSRNLCLISLGKTEATPYVSSKGEVIYPSMFLANPKKLPRLSNKRVPLEYTKYTWVNLGRTKEFYSNPKWRSKAEEVKAKDSLRIAKAKELKSNRASRKISIANFGMGM